MKLKSKTWTLDVQQKKGSMNTIELCIEIVFNGYTEGFIDIRLQRCPWITGRIC